MTDLPAGRELNALIAERVMGREPDLMWNVFNPDETATCFHAETKRECEEFLADVLKRYPNSWMKDHHVGAWKRFPRYSTDIVPAWEVVEKLRSDGWLVTVKSMPPRSSFIIQGSNSEYDAPRPDRLVGKGKVLCEAHWMGDGFRHDAWAISDTVPLAICLVARKTLEAPHA